MTASADYTFGIALNDQNGTNLTTANTMAIMGGKVGIGKTDPDECLHLVDSTNTAIKFASSTQYGKINYNSGPECVQIQSVSSTTSNANGYVTIETAQNGATPVERMRIDSIGNVGIGRSPLALLHLQSTVPEIRFTYTSNSGYSHIKGSASNELIFSTGSTTGTERMRIDGSGHITPGVSNTQDLGSSSLYWRNLYTSDLNLSNEGTEGNSVDGTHGKWTIQEGATDLYLINELNGKQYKFNLEEV